MKYLLLLLSSALLLSSCYQEVRYSWEYESLNNKGLRIRIVQIDLNQMYIDNPHKVGDTVTIYKNSIIDWKCYDCKKVVITKVK